MSPRDQRTASTYIFGAVCPKQGKGAALILPSCKSEAMNLHLVEIAAAVAPGAAPYSWSIWPAAPVDGTRRATKHHHYGAAAEMSRAESVENVWQFLRDNWLSNRVFKSNDDLVDHCCVAWNKLVDQPWRIMSIGLRQWAYRF